MIARGTGRFRTPGFKSKPWRTDEVTTLAAIGSVNEVLAASGLGPLAITKVTSWGIAHEGVTVDPEDWRSGRTQSDIESAVKKKPSTSADSILLHSRLAASAAATPAIVADVEAELAALDPTAQGALGRQTRESRPRLQTRSGWRCSRCTQRPGHTPQFHRPRCQAL